MYITISPVIIKCDQLSIIDNICLDQVIVQKCSFPLIFGILLRDGIFYPPQCSWEDILDTAAVNKYQLPASIADISLMVEYK